MKKTALGGLVSSLVFSFGCNDSQGPAHQGAADAAAADKAPCDHAPQILFDPDTGQMTIVGDELSDAVRASLGIGDDEASSRQATLLFRDQSKREFDVAATSDNPDINIGC